MIVYFAGTETTFSGYNITPTRSDHILASYFYKKKTDDLLAKIAKDKGHEGLIFIDSGAHTFFAYDDNFNAAHQTNKKKEDMPDPDVYFAKYLKWVIENYNKIDYFAELDIGVLVGYDKVKKWREDMRKAGVFDKCVMCMHSGGMDLNKSQWQNFVDLCEEQESGYIALEGLISKKINLPYGKMLKYCYERNIKVHGFALTAKDITLKYPFSSVDSTTWTGSIRFGSILVLKNGCMVQVAPTKNNYIKYGISPKLFNINRSKEASKLKLENNMMVQRKYEKHLFNYWKTKGIEWKW